MQDLTDTNDCTTLSSSPPIFHSLSAILHVSPLFFILPFPSQDLISSLPCCSTPLAPHHLASSLFFPSPSLSQSAICWRWPITAAFWKSQLVTLSGLHLAFRRCPSRDSVASWLQKHGRVWKVGGFSVCNSQRASVLISSGKDAPESVSVSVPLPVTHE